MALTPVDPKQKISSELKQQIMDALNGIRSSPVRLTPMATNMYTVYGTSTNTDYPGYRWDPAGMGWVDASQQWSLQTVKIEKQEKSKMAKTDRNAYQFWIVDKDDQIDVQMIVAESDQEARDMIVQGLPEGVKAKDVEIRLVRTEALKPKVIKD